MKEQKKDLKNIVSNSVKPKSLLYTATGVTIGIFLEYLFAFKRGYNKKEGGLMGGEQN